MTANIAQSPAFTQRRIRLASIQICRGLAALAVVLSHLHEVELKYFHTNLLALAQYGKAGVDVFFVISGIVISLVSFGKFGQRGAALHFLYHRLARIYPAFWFYFLIVLAIWLWNPNLVNAASGHHVDVLRSFFLIPNQYRNMVAQAWTLSYELSFYIAFFVLLATARERWLPWLLAAWAAAIVGLNAGHIVPQSKVLALFCDPFVLEFLAGCGIYRLYRSGKITRGLGLACLPVAGAWLGIAIWATGGNVEQLRTSARRVEFLGTFAVLFVLAMVGLEQSYHSWLSRQFERLGDWSYSLYLSHILVLGLVGRIVGKLAARMPGSILLNVGIALPLAIMWAALSYSWMERPAVKFLYAKFADPPRADHR